MESKDYSCLIEKRNYGIDLLRLVTMFMVVIQHVMQYGGVLYESTGGKSHVVWFLETAAFCAVDCFAMISGFVSYNEIEKPYRYSKYLTFWLRVFTYSFGVTILAFMLKPESMGTNTVIKSFLPIMTGQYWYVSAYTGLFFIIPWLNKLMRTCNKKESTSLIAVILIVFVGYVMFADYWGDCFKLQDGYSFAWLSIMYLVGAWIKKCDIPKYICNSFLVIGSAISVIFSWLAHEFICIPGFGVFVNYTSFTIIFVAFSFISVFSKMRIGYKTSKVISFFAPAAFGVYLIHEQPIIRGHFINSAFAWIIESPIWLIPIQILGCAAVVFVVCLMIEKTRMFLFEMLKINQLINTIEDRLEAGIMMIEKSAIICFANNKR